MKKIIIAFKSRNNLQLFVRIMRSHSIPSEIINTPRSISISCGLSAKTDYRFLNLTINLIRSSRLEGFLGIFSMEQHGLSEHTQRIL